jgi:hypothetical protein
MHAIRHSRFPKEGADRRIGGVTQGKGKGFCCRRRRRRRRRRRISSAKRIWRDEEAKNRRRWREEAED